MSRQIELQDCYEPIAQIGTGSFGDILSVKNTNNNQIYACKIQKNHGKNFCLVQKQYRILQQLANFNNFPQVYSFKKHKQSSYMIMQLLTHNLQELLIKQKGRFSIKTVALIAYQTLQALRDLHSMDYLHRDLKPQNFMIKKGSHKIKLIDFGLADNSNVRRASMLIGNVRFCSRKAHFGISSKKDDLESLFNVLIYFLLGGLPWQNGTKQQIQLQLQRKTQFSTKVDTPILILKYNILNDLKMPDSKNEIKKQFYKQFFKLVQIVFNMQVSQQPDYKLLIHNSQRLIILAGCNKNSCFDWCRQDCYENKNEQLWSIFN